MSRGKLNEVYVQDVAVKHLKQYYSSRFNSIKIFSGKELCIKKSFSGKRVDGLIALKLSDEDIFVSVVEAKSYRTLYSLIPVDGNERWFIHGALFGIIVAVAINFLFSLSVILRVCASIGTMFIGAFLYWVATFKLTRYRYVDVLRQISNYPGHEKWVAFSIDVFNTLDKSQKNDFIRKLKNDGVGLLIVYPGKKATIELKPKEQSTKRSFKNVLQFYNKCDDIKKQI